MASSFTGKRKTFFPLGRGLGQPQEEESEAAYRGLEGFEVSSRWNSGEAIPRKSLA